MHSSLLNQIDTVARTGSIRGASELLNVSASSINRRLIQLEEELGSPLFLRQKSGMHPTAAGEVVLAHIRQTLRDADRMAKRLEELRGLGGARVRIAAMQGLTEELLPRVLAEFRDSHPAVTVTVRARALGDVETDLEAGEADLGLSYALPQDRRLPLADVFRTRLGAVVATDHPLAARSDLRLSELQDWPLAVADESLIIHPLIVEAFDRAGAALKPAYHSNAPGFLKYLARAGAAVTFLSRIDVDEDLRAGRLRYIPLLGRALRSHELRLGHRRGAMLSPAVALVAERIRTALAAIQSLDIGR